MEAISKNLTTPRGTFLFPRVNTPEMPPYEGYDGPPLYSVTLRLKEDEASNLMNELDAMFEENIKACKKEHGARKVKAADKPYSPEFDRDTDEETGYILFRTKLPSEATRKRDGKTFKLRPDIFDAKGNPAKNVDVGGGSIGKLSVEARSWYMGATKNAGIKLTLRAVQVIELRQHSGGTADDHGFGAEDGWETQASKAGFGDETAPEEKEEAVSSTGTADDKGGNF